MTQALVIGSPDEAVGMKVNAFLFRKRETKKALGTVLGVSAATAGRKINGEIGWSLDDLYRTAEFFGVEITDLLPRRIANEEAASLSADGHLVAGAGFEPTTSGL